MEDNPQHSDREGQQSGCRKTSQLADDEYYRALASTERRRLLYMLLVEEECTVGKIATVLSGWEATETEKMTTPEDREQIRLELEHVHLPMLSETGLVAYDCEDEVVSIGPLDEAVTELIRVSVETESCQ